MKTLIIPGYGDRHDYIERFTRHWPERFGLEPEVYEFGWSGNIDSYDEKWDAFETHLKAIGETAIIGISAGAGVGLRALQTHPDTVTGLVTVCGPVDIDLMNLETIHTKYPLIEKSLRSLDVTNVPAERVMTIRPRYDEVVSLDAMSVDGAKDVRVNTVGHAFTIGWTMFAHGKTISRFINNL